jgi:hypothetical protein
LLKCGAILKLNEIAGYARIDRSCKLKYFVVAMQQASDVRVVEETPLWVGRRLVFWRAENVAGRKKFTHRQAIGFFFDRTAQLISVDNHHATSPTQYNFPPAWIARGTGHQGYLWRQEAPAQWTCEPKRTPPSRAKQ